jgi:hypothetical protein
MDQMLTEITLFIQYLRTLGHRCAASIKIASQMRRRSLDRCKYRDMVYIQQKAVVANAGIKMGMRTYRGLWRIDRQKLAVYRLSTHPT